MRRALFVTYGGGHVNMTIPVLRELERRGGWETTVLGLTTARPVLEAAGIPCLGFRELVRPEDRDALAHGEALARKHHTPGIGVDLEESVAYLGLSYADLERREGTKEAERRLAERGRMAFLPLGPLERVVDRVRPDVIVGTCSPRAEEAAIRTARNRGLPSLCMSDLFGLDRTNGYIWEPGYGDRVTVLSDWVKHILIQHGRPGSEVVVTGNPAFDRLAQPDLAKRAAQWRRDQGWDDRVRVVTWASQPEPLRPDLPARVLSSLIEAVSRHPDWRLVHRRHPSEPVDSPLSPSARLSTGSDELAVLLQASDVVVVLITTVGLEAALLDRAVVKLCASAQDYTAPYEEMGIAFPARRLEDLEGAIERVLSEGEEARRLREARRKLPPAGGAAAAVADAVEDLMNGPGNPAGPSA